MRFVEVNGVRLSAIGLGTWQFGSRDWGYGPDYAQHEAGRIVERALDLGVNLFDTAEVYGHHASERILGRALADRRQDAFVATKFLPVLPLPAVIERHGRASAHRLGVDRIDLYQIHWPNPVVPIGWQMRGVRALLDDGIVAHAGVSNFGLGRWRAAERALGAPVLSNQVQYSLVARKPDVELVPYAQASDRLVIAYSPLGMGLLSGRYDAHHPPTGSARLNNPLFLPESIERAAPLIDVVRQVADARGATPAQVALAWVVAHANVVAVPGASSVAQLEANVAAADIELSDDERTRLTRASDGFTPVSLVAAGPKILRRRLRGGAR